MNEQQIKGAGLKYILFIGIPVIIILGVLGAYYQMTNPIQILNKTINVAYKNVDSLFDNLEERENLNDTTFEWKGNLDFKTDLDLSEIENLQRYNYDFNIIADLKQEFVSLKLGINEENNKLIDANFYQIGNEQYIESKDIFDNILKIPDTEKSFNEIFDFSDFYKITQNENIEDTRYLLKQLKEAFEKTLNKKFITREKTDITINGRKIKTTKITYLLNEENQKNTMKIMSEELSKDQKFIEILAKFNNTTEEEIKKMINNDFTYKKDYTINIYTEGFNQNVVRISLLENAVEQITYLSDDSNKTLNIQNDFIITLKQLTENEIKLDYNIKSSNISGTLNIVTENEKTDYFVTLNSSDINLTLNLKTVINFGIEIEKPNISSAINVEDLPPSEIRNILENIEEVLEDTFFYDLMDRNIM